MGKVYNRDSFYEEFCKIFKKAGLEKACDGKYPIVCEEEREGYFLLSDEGSLLLDGGDNEWVDISLCASDADAMKYRKRETAWRDEKEDTGLLDDKRTMTIFFKSGAKIYMTANFTYSGSCSPLFIAVLFATDGLKTESLERLDARYLKNGKILENNGREYVLHSLQRE